jgi:GTP-binding protein EngB required for normal cell division
MSEHEIDEIDERDAAYGLRAYVTIKQAVADVAREALRLLEGVDRQTEEGLRDILARLAEDRFNLVVVGQFKRGKSSLMNALIGRDVLPTGLLPLTSAITSLRYGSRERVYLQRSGWTTEQEIPLRELAEYVTEQGNPNNEKGVIEARIELPARFLRRGLFFVDTPGVGSASESASATTHTFLPQADAIIFVTSVDAPMSGVEMDFLQAIQAYSRTLFMVVNKMDVFDGEPNGERERVLSFIRDRASQALGGAVASLYPVSARQGLAAQRQQDADTLQRSGIPALERALAEYLTREQGRAFLLRMLDRLMEALDRVPLRDQQERSAAIARLSERAAALRATLAEGSMIPTLAPTAPPLTDVPETAAVVEALSASGSAIEHESGASAAKPAQTPRTATSASRCPICAALSEALFALFARWQYTLATSDEARRTFAAAGGFCAFHTWQFERVASPQGISESYTPLVARIEAELRAALNSGSQSSGQARDLAERVGRLAPSRDTCPACHALEAERARRIGALLTRLDNGIQADAALPTFSLTLCLPHLGDAVAATGEASAGVAAFLLREQARRLEDLSDDLRSYLLKRAALRRGLLTGEEDSAWRRALTLLAGERDAYLP